MGWSGSLLAREIPEREEFGTGAAKDWFLTDAEPPATVTALQGQGQSQWDKLWRCLCSLGGCFSHDMSSSTSAQVGCGALGRMVWPVYVQGGC